jgi:hypothetical protein
MPVPLWLDGAEALRILLGRMSRPSRSELNVRCGVVMSSGDSGLLLLPCLKGATGMSSNQPPRRS